MDHGIKMLEVPVNLMGRPGILNLTLLRDGENVILVDTGLPGQLATIRDAMQQQADLAFEQITQVILTHHDIDHIGGLRELRGELAGKVRVLAHVDEKDYIEGKKRPLKLVKLEENFENLPDATKTIYATMKNAFDKSTAPVDEVLKDGDELPYCGGITVIFTPGHTLGHISLYVRESKTLIAGDALRVDENGMLDFSTPSSNYDMDMCKQSIQKLTRYDIETILCYHGGRYQTNVNQRIAELAR